MVGLHHVANHPHHPAFVCATITQEGVGSQLLSDQCLGWQSCAALLVLCRNDVRHATLDKECLDPGIIYFDLILLLPELFGYATVALLERTGRQVCGC